MGLWFLPRTSTDLSQFFRQDFVCMGCLLSRSNVFVFCIFHHRSTYDVVQYCRVPYYNGSLFPVNPCTWSSYSPEHFKIQHIWLYSQDVSIYIYIIYIYYILRNSRCLWCIFYGHLNFGHIAQYVDSQVLKQPFKSWWVIKWKHFPRYWPFVRGFHRSPENSPHRGQWRGALMFSLICAWINGWVNNGEAVDLRRHRVHYDVTLMYKTSYHMALAWPS